jgi:hypothetical protein
VDKALYKANTAILVGTSTWLEQFKQAFSVKGRGIMSSLIVSVIHWL